MEVDVEQLRLFPLPGKQPVGIKSKILKSVRFSGLLVFLFSFLNERFCVLEVQ